MELIESILAIVGAVVAGATLIVAGLEKIAGITATTKDDLYVGKAKKALAYVSDILSAVSVKKPTK